MTITAVGTQEGGVTFDSATSTTRAFGANVAVGNLVAVACWKITVGGSDPFLAADCTKSAGTATIDTPTLDVAIELQHDAGADRIAVGIWSCKVTGAGSLTMQVGGMTAGSYGGLATGEYNSSVGWDATRVEATNSKPDATDNATAASTNSGTSAGAALFMAGVVIPGSGAITITPDSLFTQIYEVEDNSIHQAGSVLRRIVSGGTTDASDWTISGNNLGYCAALAVYKESGGGPEARTFSSAGLAVATFTAVATVAQSLSAAGVGAATFSGAGIDGRPFSSAGAGAGTWLSATVLPASVASAGTGAATWLLATVLPAALASAGAGAASFDAKAVANASLSSSGSALASWIGTDAGSTTESRSFASNGVASASFTAVAIETRTLSSSGVGAATFASAAYFTASLSAVGVGAATFQGAQIEPRQSTAPGVASAVFVGVDGNIPTVEARSLSAAGAATALFVGEDVGQPISMPAGQGNLGWAVEPHADHRKKKKKLTEDSLRTELEKVYEQIPAKVTIQDLLLRVDNLASSVTQLKDQVEALRQKPAETAAEVKRRNQAILFLS